MPSKGSIVAKQHYIYIIQDEEWVADDPDVDGNFDNYCLMTRDLFDVHADLELAKSSARQHFMTRNECFESEEFLEDTTRDYETAYSIRCLGVLDGVPASIRTRVVTMPLVGGNISFQRVKNDIAKAKSLVSVQTDEEDELKEDITPTPTRPVSRATVSVAAALAGKKRKPLDEVDEEADDGTESPQLADAEHHFAPSGEGNCLKGLSILIAGTLDPWTHDQAKALIEFFGGTMESNLKIALDYVVVATKPGVKKLSELSEPKYSGIKKISEQDLYELIETTKGNGQIYSKETVTALCKAAKKAPKKRVKKA